MFFRQPILRYLETKRQELRLSKLPLVKCVENGSSKAACEVYSRCTRPAGGLGRQVKNMADSIISCMTI